MEKILEKINYKKIILAVIIMGIILRIIYIAYTPITKRQHDMEKEVGHLAYIETIYETGKLPEHNKWQFYQQPLHHIISAGWLKLAEVFGIGLENAEESLQILTAIYSSVIIVISYFILKELGIDDKLKLLVITIIAVHPTFIILSGSINNDILMIMLTFLGILYLIKWYKNSNLKNTIILALTTGLIALTKISGVIIAVPILYVFIDKFWKDYFTEKNGKKIIKKYILECIIFGIIALGIGLSYSIRNLLLFNQSIFYVPKAGQAIYCGERNFFDRFNLFSKEWLNVFAYPVNDCNIWAYLIKSSLFGEYHLKNINLISIFMLILNVVIIIVSLICLVKLVFTKGKSTEIKMIILFYCTEILMFLYSNIKKPYACTMDFRYIVPTILFGMIFIADGVKGIKCEKAVSCMVYLFAILAVVFEVIYMQNLSV